MQTTSHLQSVVHDHIVIRDIHATAYTIPTDQPESDGTLEWDSTTLVLVEIEAGNEKGIGYTYADASTAYFINKTVKDQLTGSDALDIPAVMSKLKKSIRNQGSCGIAMMALSALDCALWDLKGKILELPLAYLLGRTREDVPVYGSGGFTSYSVKEVREQLEGWAEDGFGAVKIKIGRKPESDVTRVKAARESIGDNVDLFVDANGAYEMRQALEKGNQFSAFNVTWFEEPVSSDNLTSLRFLKERVNPPVKIVAGEYGYNLSYFLQMVEAKAVDILQADATRCGGITDFLKAGYLTECYKIPFSSHCAPSLHAQAALALPSFYIGEYFYDHVRIEKMLFDESLNLSEGKIKPDFTRPGLGLVFKYSDAEKYKV